MKFGGDMTKYIAAATIAIEIDGKWCSLRNIEWLVAARIYIQAAKAARLKGERGKAARMLRYAGWYRRWRGMGL